MDNIMNKKISEISERETMTGQYYIRLSSGFRTGDRDPETLIDLIRQAMGKRSQRKFAEDMGVNVSSISRIMNGKVSEVSNILLAKIAANADPDSGVTLEKLMGAQGIIEAENREQLAAKYEENCRRIIADELLKRGYTVSYHKATQNRSRYICDFEIETDALTKGGGRWLFEVKMLTVHTILPTGYGGSMIWMDSAMAAYYRGESIGRVSMVVDHRTMFDQMKERLGRTAIKDEISIILISVGTGKIVEEYVAPLADGSKPQFVFSTKDLEGKE